MIITQITETWEEGQSTRRFETIPKDVPTRMSLTGENIREHANSLFQRIRLGAFQSGAIIRIFGNKVIPPEISIKSANALVVVASMVSMGVIIAIWVWFGARQSLVHNAAQSANFAAQMINERSQRLVEPAFGGIKILASTEIAKASSLEDRLRNLKTFTSILTSSTIISHVMVGYEDGSFFLVRKLTSDTERTRFLAPHSAKFMVQSIQSKSFGKEREFLFFDERSALIERRDQPSYQFDPRTRPWFKESSKTTTLVSTQPYIFYTTRQVGITLSQRSDEGAIFGIDVVLDDLASTLSQFRATSNMELAIADGNQRVLVYPDMAKTLAIGDDSVKFKTLENFDIPCLAAFGSLAVSTNDVVTYELNDSEWVGIRVPFVAWPIDGLQLLLTAPASDFSEKLNGKLTSFAALIIFSSLFLLPFGWLSGTAIGRSLDNLMIVTKRIRHFDLGSKHPSLSRIREVNGLYSALSEMDRTIDSFLTIGQVLAMEPKVESMLTKVLEQLVGITGSIGGAVYLCDDSSGELVKTAAYGVLLPHDISLPTKSFCEDKTLVTQLTGLSTAELHVVLRDRDGALSGLLVLQYPNDEEHSNNQFSKFVERLSGMLAVSIETRKLVESQKKLLESLIRLMASAIDAKSPYTAGHCDRVPKLAGLIVDKLSEESNGKYADFRLTEEERYEFHLGAWLHDCGKVTSPEHIIDKATKLECIYNRIHEVRMRFEVLLRDARLDYWKGIAAGQDVEVLRGILTSKELELESDFEFIASCNIGAESMSDESVARLKNLSQITWSRHFDDRKGLSQKELLQIVSVEPISRAIPCVETLLSDKAAHMVEWGERRPPVEIDNPNNTHGFDMKLPNHEQNLGEVYNLSISRGTLTAEDRFKINDHIVQTLIMLRSLPWPKHLSRVPDIAATHHERLDGSGYPRRLGEKDLTIVDRAMAIADVFEALTAADRPYKSPKKLSETFSIMTSMAKNGHIDKDLFDYFVAHELWSEFAIQYLTSDQIDIISWS